MIIMNICMRLISIVSSPYFWVLCPCVQTTVSQRYFFEKKFEKSLVSLLKVYSLSPICAGFTKQYRIAAFA